MTKQEQLDRWQAIQDTPCNDGNTAEMQINEMQDVETMASLVSIIQTNADTLMGLIDCQRRGDTTSGLPGQLLGFGSPVTTDQLCDALASLDKSIKNYNEAEIETPLYLDADYRQVWCDGH